MGDSWTKAVVVDEAAKQPPQLSRLVCQGIKIVFRFLQKEAKVLEGRRSNGRSFQSLWAEYAKLWDNCWEQEYIPWLKITCPDYFYAYFWNLHMDKGIPWAILVPHIAGFYKQWPRLGNNSEMNWKPMWFYWSRNRSTPLQSADHPTQSILQTLQALRIFSCTACEQGITMIQSATDQGIRKNDSSRGNAGPCIGF